MKSIDILISDLHAGKYGFQSQPDVRAQAIRNVLDYIDSIRNTHGVRLLIGGDLLNKVDEPNMNFDDAVARRELGPIGDLLSSASSVQTDVMSGNCDRAWFSKKPELVADYLNYTGDEHRLTVLQEIVHVRDRLLYVHGDLFEPSLKNIAVSSLGFPSAEATKNMAYNLKRAQENDVSFPAELEAMNLEHEAHYNMYCVQQRVFGLIPPLNAIANRFLHKGINGLYAGTMVERYGQVGGPDIWMNGHTHMATHVTGEQLKEYWKIDTAPAHYMDTGTVTADKREIGTFAVIPEGEDPMLMVSWQPDLTARVSTVDQLKPTFKRLVTF